MAQERGEAAGTLTRVLVREPLLWAAAAAFIGAAVGLAGTSRLAAWLENAYGSAGPPPMLAWPVAPLGELLVAISLLGTLPLLGIVPRAARAARLVGVPPVLLLFFAFLGTAASALGWPPFGGATPSSGAQPLLAVSLALGLILPPVAVLPFAVAAFLDREARIGTLLLGLCALAVPHLLVWQLFSGGTLGAIPQDAAVSVVLGGIGAGVSLLEAPLWALFGFVLFRAAWQRARGGGFRAREKANVRAARRLYEGALGAGDASVVDDLVSEECRDLKSGAPDLAIEALHIPVPLIEESTL